MIKPKEKPCKGIGIAKGYGCGKPTIHRVNGLGKMCCYADWLYNSEQGKIKLQKAIIKATKPRLELRKAEQESKKNKSLFYLIQNTVNICHEYIKLRDKYKPCISCQSAWHSDFQAGHFYKAELFSTLKFNELNVNGQCPGCNIYKEGNESEYRVNLPNRIGIENYRELERLASIDKQIDFKWDRQKLIETRDYYKKLIKDLKAIEKK